MSLRKKITDSFNALLGRKVARDAYEGSSIRIPYSAPSGGAKFGEAITDSDREFAATREPVGHFVTFSVAEDMFDNWFQVDDLRTEGKDVGFNDAVQVALSKLKAREAFIRAAIFERVHGWCMIAVNFADGGDQATEVREGAEVRDLFVYSKRKIARIEEDKDPNSPRYGLPQTYYLNRGTAGQLKLHYSRVIHIAPRLSWSHEYEGVSVLDPIWDDLTNLRNIRWGMGQTMYRYGSGFPDIEIQGATKEQLDDFIESGQFKDLHSRTYFVHNERQKLEFKGASGVALDPEKYYKPIMESLSVGTKIPEPILRGAQAGALTGSEVNEREYFKVVSSAQTLYEPYIRWLIDRLMASGQIDAKVEDYAINWVGGFEVNEKDKAQAEQMRESANVLRTNYMTVNEIRAQEGLEPVEGGDVVLGLQKLKISPGGF